MSSGLSVGCKEACVLMCKSQVSNVQSTGTGNVHAQQASSFDTACSTLNSYSRPHSAGAGGEDIYNAYVLGELISICEAHKRYADFCCALAVWRGRAWVRAGAGGHSPDDQDGRLPATVQTECIADMPARGLQRSGARGQFGCVVKHCECERPQPRVGRPQTAMMQTCDMAQTCDRTQMCRASGTGIYPCQAASRTGVSKGRHAGARDVGVLGRQGCGASGGGKHVKLAKVRSGPQVPLEVRCAGVGWGVDVRGERTMWPCSKVRLKQGHWQG
jgi:hypothetical protein